MKRLLLCAMVVFLAGCDAPATTPQSAPAVHKVTAEVPVNQAGHTVEQENIAARLRADNQPGAIKHLYVISAYSGQVLIYSIVRGNVTSSGKRLSPITVAAADGEYVSDQQTGMSVSVGGEWHRTTEVLQDDGTYGTSSEYIYWWDAKGIYHQHYISGGQIVHISNQPLAVKGVIINMELSR